MMFRAPAPKGRCYVGVRQAEHVGPELVERVDPPNKRSPLDPRYDLANHSPDGFNWGYGGSGPAQLALALVCDATGDDKLALAAYQHFKREIVAGLPDRWQLEAENIAAFAATLRHKVMP